MRLFNSPEELPLCAGLTMVLCVMWLLKGKGWLALAAQVAQARGDPGAQRAHEGMAHAGPPHRFEFHQVRVQRTSVSESDGGYVLGLPAVAVTSR